MPLSGNRQRAGLLVDAQRDPQVRIAFIERGVGERFEAQLVGCVGCVRNQLPQEDLLVAVQGVDHQREQLLDLGLESERPAG
jgi:hypothetical protein